MALSPSIPTSFVPKQSVSPNASRGKSGNNIFLLVSMVILGIAILASAGVFLYDQYLISTENAKTAQLAQAQKNVNLTTVSDFIRLRDRLEASKSILDNHIELSKFFTLLGSITGQNVAFTSLQIQVAQDHSAKIELQGTAKSFNALAVESSTFAAQPDIKSAIFSNISINKSTVGFTVDATLAPELVVEDAAPTGAAVVQSMPTSSTTPPAAIQVAPITSSTTAAVAPTKAPSVPQATASTTTP